MTDLRPLPGVDIDWVRFDAEDRLGPRTGWHVPPEAIKMFPEVLADRRRELRARALLLSESMAPDAHRALADAKARLGVTEPVELYQSRRLSETSREPVEHGNARLHVDGPPAVEILGGCLGTMDRAALTAMCGHELGHLLAHCQEVYPGGPRIPLRLETWGSIDPSHRPLSLAREITADRFGLIACPDLAASLRLHMMLTAGMPGGGLTWDTDAYLTECRALVEDLLRDGHWAYGSTHPEHSVRAYALWLFSESEAYHEITGQGPGHRPIAEVDRVLTRLLPLTIPLPPNREPRPRATRPPAPLPPPSPLSPPAPSPLPPAPSPPPVAPAAKAPLAAATKAPSQVQTLTGVLSDVQEQVSRSVQGIAARVAAVLSTADPPVPAADEVDPALDLGDDDDLRARFAELEQRLARSSGDGSSAKLPR